jgi:hypothetical protein
MRCGDPQMVSPTISIGVPNAKTSRSTQIEEQESKKHVGFAREGSGIVALLGLVDNDFRSYL